MKSIDRAKEEMFRNSTRAEMREYCKMEKVEGVKPQHLDAALRNLLCKHFGLSVDPTSPVANIMARIKPTARVTPEYNLRPDGIFGGRRWRGKTMKPHSEMMKRDKGMYVFANGSYGGPKEGYPIEFDCVQVIPEPIYKRLKELERTTSRTEGTKVVIDDVEFVNKAIVFEHAPMYHMEYQIEEGTEHLAGSMQEWYQAKEPKWYYELELRDMQTVATTLGLDIKEYNEKGTKQTVVIPLETLRANVFRFVYGYAEVELEEEAA